nr:MAG TPA_asm: hypothetical protein [Caudoviricetes sp.]
MPLKVSSRLFPRTPGCFRLLRLIHTSLSLVTGCRPCGTKNNNTPG